MNQRHHYRELSFELSVEGENGKRFVVGLEEIPQKSKECYRKNINFGGRHRWFGILAPIYTVYDLKK